MGRSHPLQEQPLGTRFRYRLANPRPLYKNTVTGAPIEAQMKELTSQQQKILQVIRETIEATGFPPTRAEIADTLGFASPNAADSGESRCGRVWRSTAGFPPGTGFWAGGRRRSCRARRSWSEAPSGVRLTLSASPRRAKSVAAPGPEKGLGFAGLPTYNPPQPEKTVHPFSRKQPEDCES